MDESEYLNVSKLLSFFVDKMYLDYFSFFCFVEEMCLNYLEFCL